MKNKTNKKPLFKKRKVFYVLRGLTPFYLYTSIYLCCVELSTLVLYFLVWNTSDPKDKFSFYAFIMNNKVLLYCIVSELAQNVPLHKVKLNHTAL